jgi:hypothetical protein
MSQQKSVFIRLRRTFCYLRRKWLLAKCVRTLSLSLAPGQLGHGETTDKAVSGIGIGIPGRTYGQVGSTISCLYPVLSSCAKYPLRPSFIKMKLKVVCVPNAINRIWIYSLRSESANYKDAKSVGNDAKNL